MWARHDGYQDVVHKGWQAGSTDLAELHEALGQVRSDLSVWSRETFGSVRKQLWQMHAKLDEVRAGSIGSGPSRLERELMRKISELMSREESMMKQRSRVLWLAEGD